MGKLIVELPDEIHREIKKKAIADHRTLKNIVTSLIHEYLLEERRMPTVKESGLCGSWDDERTAEEIIKDIKAQRRWFKRQVN